MAVVVVHTLAPNGDGRACRGSPAHSGHGYPSRKRSSAADIVAVSLSLSVSRPHDPKRAIESLLMHSQPRCEAVEHSAADDGLHLEELGCYVATEKDGRVIARDD